MLPARNRRDLEDIPDETRRQLEFIWLEHVEDAVTAGLENTKAPLAYPPPSSPAHLAELIA
jgi:ATP-dependent Lon protease